jgi:hypothetical protein
MREPADDPEYRFTLRQVDQARGDLYAIADEIEFLKVQVAALPDRALPQPAGTHGVGLGVGLDRGCVDPRPMIDDQAWCQLAGTHYRELAAWLREIGGKCRLPNPQRELLSLARRYELRADELDRRSRQGQSEIVTAARCWIMALSLAWLSSSALAAYLSRTARVIDGDTIVIGDAHIRLPAGRGARRGITTATGASLRRVRPKPAS